MRITKNFEGGNIRVRKIEDNTVYLSVELRDTVGDWFYWAFRVDDAAGRTLRFVFENTTRVGFYGAAVSHDGRSWQWQYEAPDHHGGEFSYTFAADENRVYFAHHILYLPERLYAFAEAHRLPVDTLCVTRRGRNVPCLTIGSGSRHILLTSRHHACEATGSFVLEGVLEELIENPIPDTTVFCVPMVDYDGVCDGDQGKNRAPHDHNRDYMPDKTPLYPEIAAIEKYMKTHDVVIGADFHSPHHLCDPTGMGSENNRLFFVYSICDRYDEIAGFSALMEKKMRAGAMEHRAEFDVSPKNRPWLSEGLPNFDNAVLRLTNGLPLTVETAYYGLGAGKFTEEAAVLAGKSFADALREEVQ